MNAPARSIQLGEIAYARSGDKGTNANVGVIARTPSDYELLRQYLTADKVAEYFLPLSVVAVQRYELPNLGAFNFVLKGVLADRLRNDAQGKALGQAILEMQIEVV
ncbi:MAG: hypothetical protein O3C40_28800 [Planctomycetota bacterium]|nr:hypothetical protein [Planctomycetota bacterium]